MSVPEIEVEKVKYDKPFTPAVVTLRFANGEVSTYDKRGDEYSTPEGARLKVPQFKQPQYDLPDQKQEETSFEAMLKNYAAKLRTLDEQKKAASKQMAEDYESASKQMLEDYESLKKDLQSQMEELKHPAKRIQIICNWLRETNVDEMMEAAKMLESEAEYIIKKVESSEMKYDVFLSNVQRYSADVSDSLQKMGVRVCFTISGENPDTQGIVDGVLNSSVFAVILTADYFQRPFCVFEYFISVAAGKPVIPAYEWDPFRGGGKPESFQFPRMVQGILNQELVQVNRAYWEPFMQRFYSRMKKFFGPRSSILSWVQRSWLDAELKKEGLVFGNRLYSSSLDGVTVKAFHTSCDGRGPTLSVVETNTGRIFGGFTSEPWSSVAQYRSAASVWLFAQDLEDSLKRINIREGERKHAVYHSPDYGPIFGSGNDLRINPGGTCVVKQSSFEAKVAEERYVKIKQYEVFQVAKLVV